METMLDIAIFRTNSGFKIMSTGYHKEVPVDNVLPLDDHAEDVDSLMRRLNLIVRSQINTQTILDEKGYKGFKEYLTRIKG